MTQIHWLGQADGLFTTAADWSGGTVPGAGDGALLDAAGALNYTVTSTGNVTVGSLSTGATATLAITAAKVFDALAGTGAGANAGTIAVGNGARFEAAGSLANTGLISIAGTTKATSLFVTAGGATLTGGGRLSLAGATSAVFAVSAATVLTNVDNTISGAGQLGNGKLTFVNEAAGVVNANAAAALVVNTLGSVLTNDGLIESTGVGGLIVRNTTVDDSGGGTINAAGGQMRLQGAHLIGGVLTTSGGGAIHASSGTNFLDGGAGTLANHGAVIVDSGHDLTLEGAIANSGTININGGAVTTTLGVGSVGATLSGGGKILLSNSAFGRIIGATASATLTNVDNTIAGGGQIGAGSLTLVNQAKGVINASTATALVLNTNGEDVVNDGLIEGTGTGGLTILNTTVDDSGGGTVFAGAGSKVTLNRSVILGGVLTTKSTGVITTVGRLSVLDGATSTLSIKGAVTVADNTSLTLRGAIANTGKISLASTGDVTQLLIGASGLTLTGAGTVALGNNAANQIRQTTAASLVNVDNTISGAGTFGNSNLAIDNQAKGVINANQTTALILTTPGHAVANEGLIEGTGTGGLTISGTTITGAGVVEAANGSKISLAGARISGGTLTTLGTGVIQTVGAGSVIDGTSTHPVTLVGKLQVSGGATLTAQGQITLGQTVGTTVTQGTISLSGGGATDLLIGAPGATLSGQGGVIMGDTGSGGITGTLTGAAVSRLTNTAVIIGTGALGANLSLVNTGIIAAYGANTLTLETGNSGVKGSNVIVNSGLIEDANPYGVAVSGGLEITGVSITGAGTIEANGSGAHVDLYNSTISGQTLASYGGSINAVGYGDLLDGTTASVTNLGTVSVGAHARLALQGTIAGTGAIALNGVSGGFAALAIGAKGATLTGGGKLILSDSTYNSAYVVTGAGTLTNVNDTISGAGFFSYNLGLVNQLAGVIEATGTSKLVLLDRTVANAGLIENLGAGGLEIDGSVTNSGAIVGAGAGQLTVFGAVANTGALGAKTGSLLLEGHTVTNAGLGNVTAAVGGQVILSGETIAGGTVATAVGGVIDVYGFSMVKAATLTNQGTVIVTGGGGNLSLRGLANNTGAIDLAGGNARLAIMAPGVTLSGGGDLTLSDDTRNYVYAYHGGPATLTNVDNTISGAGNLGGIGLTLINQAAGIIDATGVNSLYLYSGTTAITNAGLIESTGAGGMVLMSPVTNSGTIAAVGKGALEVTRNVANSGTLEADGGTLFLQSATVTNSGAGAVRALAGSDVELHGAAILGGSLYSAVGGVVGIVGSVTVKTATLTNHGTVAVAANSDLVLQGLVNNTGAIDVGGATGAARVEIAPAGVNLTGGGAVVLGDNVSNYVYGGPSLTTFTNTGDTISGAGRIGTQLTLINKAAGVIDANGTQALTLATAARTITNAGLIEATGAGGLVIDSAVANSGTLAANGGGVLLSYATIANTGFGSVTVAAGSTLDLYIAAISGGTVTNAVGGKITIDVGGSDTLAATSLINQGTISVVDGARLLLAGAVNNSGAIDVGGAAGYGALGILAGGVSLTGGGAVVLTDNGNPVIYAVGAATLTNVSDTISGAGRIQGVSLKFVNQAAGVVDANGSHQLYLGANGSTTNAGLIEVTGAGGLTIFDAVANSGTILAAGTGTLVTANAIANSGALEAKQGVLKLGGNVTNTSTGKIAADAGAEVEIVGVTILGGTVSTAVGGVIKVDGGLASNLLANTLTNQGTISVASDSRLHLQGLVNNTGAITLGSAGAAGRLGVLSGGVTLTGHGTVTLGDNVNSYLADYIGTTTLTNVSNTISGAALMGAGLNVVNEAAGVIDATGVNAIRFSNGGASLTNAGLMEDTGSGGLSIFSLTNSGTILAAGSGGVTFQDAVSNSGRMIANGGALIIKSAVTNTAAGVVTAAAGSEIDLIGGSALVGGTVSIASGGQLVAVSGFDTLEAATLTNRGTIAVADGSALITQGLVNNLGAIDIGDSGGSGQLIIGAGGALTLDGGGAVTLSDNASNIIEGSGPATLTNASDTISGAGIFVSNLSLTNKSAGVIDANGVNALTLHATITNTGLIEATGAGGLIIDGAIANSGTLAAKGGVLTLNGNTVTDVPVAVVTAAAGSQIVLNGATILGGKVSTAVGGLITVASGSTGTLLATALTNQGTISSGGARLLLAGLVNNSGAIELGAGGAAKLGVLAAGVTLTGGGTVDIGDDVQSIVYAYAGATNFTNINNTIVGGGSIGGQLRIVNQAAGVIDASGKQALVIGPNQSFTNAGLLEATAAGGLTLSQDTVFGGGTIAANGATAHVDLTNTTISGETLITSAGGVIDALGTGDLLDGKTAAVTVNGTVSVGDGASLKIQGTIAGSGVIAVDSAGTQASLAVTTNGVTLTGGGTIALGDSTENLIYAYGGASTLTNVSDTISGAGTIGGSGFTLINQAAGVIDATGANALILDTSASTIANAGLIEATGAGGLSLSQDTISGGGTIAAIGAASHVDLTNTTISGETLITSAGGVINALGTGDLLDGTTAAVTVEGTVSLGDSTRLKVQGRIAGSGVIAVDSAGNHTVLAVTTNGVTLTGGGTIALADIASNLVYAYGGAATLTNVSDTISGAGTIGGGGLTVNNHAAGVIDATGVNALILDTGANTIVNAGLIEATGAGGLVINSYVANSGTLEGVGGVLTLNGVNVTNTATGLVTAVDGFGIDLYGSLIGGTVSTAVGGVIAVRGVSAIEPATLTNQGTINIANTGTLYLNGLVNNSGVIDIGSAGGNARVDIDTAGLTLTGGGTVALSDDPGGRIYAPSGVSLVNIDNTISGAGLIGGVGVSITNQAAGVIDATGANALTVNPSNESLTNAGLIEATGAGGLVLNGYIANGGTLEGDGGVLTLNGADVTNTAAGVVTAADGSGIYLRNATILGGTVSTAAGGVITAAYYLCRIAAATVTNQGTIRIANYSRLYLNGLVNNSGVIEVAPAGHYGTISADSAGLTLTGGGTVAFDGDHSQIYVKSGGSLVNVDNTIFGGGTIWNAGLTTNNQVAGVIDANGINVLAVYGDITNAGLMEATGAGGLVIAGNVANSGTLEGNGGVLTLNGIAVTNTAAGVVTAADGYGIVLNSATIVGGALSTAVGGLIDTINGASTLNGATVTNLGTVGVIAGAELDLVGAAILGGVITNAGVMLLSGSDTLAAATLNNQGTLTFANYAGIQLQGLVHNTGTIVIGASSFSLGTGTTPSVVITGATSLTGGGQVVLSYGGFRPCIYDSGGGATFTNVDNTITGYGQIGGPAGGPVAGLTVINQAAGVIDANVGGYIDISCPETSVVNAGLIECTGIGNLGINGNLTNTGTIKVDGRLLYVYGNVSGAGVAVINSGTLHTFGAFTEDVTFTGSSGVLQMDQSAGFGGSITGFSLTGGASFDLGDIGFVSAGEATFSGDASGGTLTVTDGTNTASIHLIGDYTGSTFVASADGQGGTRIVDPPKSASASGFAGAMAGFGAAASPASSATAVATPPPPTILAVAGSPHGSG